MFRLFKEEVTLHRGAQHVWTIEEEQEVRGRNLMVHITQEGGALGVDDMVNKFSASSNKELHSADSHLEGVKQEVDESRMMLEALVGAEMNSEQEAVPQNFTIEEEPQVRGQSFTVPLKREMGGDSELDDTDTQTSRSLEAEPQLVDKRPKVFCVKEEVDEDHMMIEDGVQDFTKEEEQQVKGSSLNLHIKRAEGRASGPEDTDTKLTLSPPWQMESDEEENPSSSQIQSYMEDEPHPDILSRPEPGGTRTRPDCNSNSGVHLELSREYSGNALFEPGDQLSSGTQTTPPADQNLLTCSSCGREFSSKTSLKKHIRNNVSQDQEQMSCSYRRQRAPFQIPSDRFNCRVCRSSFYSQGILLRHAEGHCKEPERQCGLCGDLLQSTKTLIEHLRSHKEVGSTCDVCGKKWSSIRRMEIHRRVHTGEKPYHCEFCSLNFSRRESLERHMKVHSGEQPHRS
ncbi:uncharacterized protein PAE49_019917 isoform 2-T2 [Odontesthes bonariensis]|uniref:uncharacterized protein LOC142367163 isoform X2 n=1 Tax=Odontesthes bonariensis TaxID=219752 RepID=UPI003F58B62B